MSPSAGRFLGREPIGYEGSEWGLCEYIGNRALVYTDPTGHEKASVCLAEFRACIAKSVAKRDRCICQASEEARVCIKESADEARRQFVECDRIAALVRDLAIEECARRNDQNTLIGQIGYRASQGAALALYSSVSTACAATYIAAEARIAASCLAFEGGRVIACGIIWQYSNSECDTELSVCLRR
jgi:GGDEF domain-containing protein